MFFPTNSGLRRSASEAPPGHDGGRWLALTLLSCVLLSFGLLSCGADDPATNPATGGMPGIDASDGEGGMQVAGGTPGAGAGNDAPSGGFAGDSGGEGGSAGAATEGGSAGEAGGGAAGDATGGSAGAEATGGEGGTAGAPEVQDCSGKTVTPGDHEIMLEVDGRSRSYVLHVPDSVDASGPVPLILDFHGNGSNANAQRGSSGWQEKSDQEGFIVAYPNGLGNSWNVGVCCGEALMSNSDDVAFAKAIVEQVSAEACIDPKRVFATGHSNGAGLVHRIACEGAEVFAAVAPAASDIVTDPCEPSRPISEISFRGMADDLVDYNGGNTGSTGWYSPGAKQTLEIWKEINGCTGQVEPVLEYCETYTMCDAGTEATLCSLPDTGHDPYNNAVGFDVVDAAWAMFERQPMP